MPPGGRDTHDESDEDEQGMADLLALLADFDGAVCDQFGVGDFTVFEVDAAGFIQYRGSVDRAPV